MRYRRDLPRDLDQETLSTCIQHMCAHLATVVSSDDDPTTSRANVEILDHVDGNPGLVTVIAEIDGEPDAPYLRDDFNPAADHPGITFEPFEQPELGRVADRDALDRFRAVDL